MTKVKKDFIVDIHGTQAVTYEGLLNLFHENGGKSIETELVNDNLACPIFKAVATGEKGVFTGHGDATKDNVNSMVSQHIVRMAETRAKARALRDYNNIGMVAVEELGGDTPVASSKVSKTNGMTKGGPRVYSKDGEVDKPWLNDDKLGAVKEKLDSGEITMDDVYDRFKVSKKSREYLLGRN